MMGSAAPASSAQVQLLLALHELAELLRGERAEVSSATETLVREVWAMLCDPPVQDRLVEIRDALGELSARQAELERREVRVSKVEAAMADLAAVTSL
jgi:hypothetical protein